MKRILSLILCIFLLTCTAYIETSAEDIENPETEVMETDPVPEFFEELPVEEEIQEDDIPPAYVQEETEEILPEVSAYVQTMEISAAEGVEICRENFPDDCFRAYLSQSADLQKDGILTEEECGQVTRIDVTGTAEEKGRIQSLEGIFWFPKLTELICSHNQIAELDLSGLTELSVLNCRGNRLTELDLTANEKLQSLDCSENSLLSLNLSAAPLEFICEDNLYTVPQNQESLDLNLLPQLDCRKASNWLNGSPDEQNILKAIDDSLPVTYQYDTGVQKEDGSFLMISCSFLFSIEKVAVDEMSFPDPVFRSYVKVNIDDGDGILGPSERESVTALYFSGEDIRNLEGIRYFINLQDLNCRDVPLSALDVNGLTKLQTVSCIEVPLTGLILDGCTEIQEIRCSHYKMETVSLQNLQNLTHVSLTDGQLKTVDIENCPQIQTLSLGTNDLTSLDVGTLENLIFLSCHSNHISSLDLQNMPLLQELYCYDNQIEKLDILPCKNLKHLDCSGNRLEELDCTEGEKLESLWCTGNRLTCLNLENCVSLQEFYGEDNFRDIFSLAAPVSELSQAFHPERITNIEGGTFDGASLLLNNEVLTYTYDCGLGRLLDFHLKLNGVPAGDTLEIRDPELQAETQVYIDGKRCQVMKAGEAFFVELPQKDCRSLVVYTYHPGDGEDIHTMYPTDMKVWILKNKNGIYEAERQEELDNLLNYAGSSIRITGKRGIRMITGIPENKKQTLTGDGLCGYKLLEYGTVLAWNEALTGGGDLVLGEASARSNYAYKRGEADPVFAVKSGQVQYTNVLVGFNNEDCEKDLVMRSYMILEDWSGNEIPIYGGTVIRSIGYIASQNRNAFPAGSHAYDYIWEIIHHVYGNQFE